MILKTLYDKITTMRQNLTNIKEVNIEDVEHFYVVGSTTKEGLLEGRSNVKLDLKKVSSEGGGGDTQPSEFNAKEFGDEVVNFMFGEDMPESLVYPDTYVFYYAASQEFRTPSSAAEFTAAMYYELLVPIYSDVPDNDEYVVVRNFNPATVGQTTDTEIPFDGETYHIFTVADH